MPIEVVKYRCQHKCGARAMHTLKQATQHESKCWYNPENKTCKTCVYEQYGYEYNEGYFRGCLHNPHLTEDMTPNDSGQIAPKVGCPYWENKKTRN